MKAKDQRVAGKEGISSVKGLLLVATLAASGLWASAAMAVNYVGKLDLVQVTSNGTRFFVRASSLSLFASGDYRDVMLEGYFRKSNFSVGYQPMTCPGGITGTCGKVNFVSVDTTNF